MILQGVERYFKAILVEKCHACRDQSVSPNNPKGLSILSVGFSNRCAFSANTPGNSLSCLPVIVCK